MLASFTSLHGLTLVVDAHTTDNPQDFNEFHPWNIARSVASHRLRQLDVTDVVHDLTDKTPFVEVRLDADIHARAHRSTIHWRVLISPAGLFQAVDILYSPGSWQERQISRLAKVVGEAYLPHLPPGPARDLRGRDWR